MPDDPNQQPIEPQPSQSAGGSQSEAVPPAPEETPTTPTEPTQVVKPPISPPTPPISPTEPIPIPQFRLPFNGNFSITFSFGAQSQDERIKQKFSEWGIIGHHGLDFGLPEGAEVLAVDSGKVIQSGDNGDFGISVTTQHPWGQSLYAHLKEAKVSQDQEVKTGGVIGLSGQTGTAFGEHLHFGIKPNNPDLNNGYLGFIDSTPYLPSITPLPAEAPA